MLALNDNFINISMDIISSLIIVAVLIFSVIIHELSHGYAALMLGDPTAKLAGRLTLNPIPHLDPLGSIIIPAILALTPGGIIFGWAKPVPYNPYNLRNQKWGESVVAFAGPASNLVIAIVFGLIIRFGDLVLSPATVYMMSLVVFINILLAFFNLIPIPPLDGSKVLNAFLPYGAWVKYNEFRSAIERYGMLTTFAFIFLFIYLLWTPFIKFISTIFTLITGNVLF